MIIKNLFTRQCLLVILFSTTIFHVFAEQNIEIIGGNTTIPTVAVIDFINKDVNNTSSNSIPSNASNPTGTTNPIKKSVDQITSDTNISNIITKDLNVTGEFNATRYPNLSSITNNPQYTISGSIANGNITYQLVRNTVALTNQININTAIPILLVSQQLIFSSKNDIRHAAHMASNTVYEKLTSSKGIFTSKIAYVVRNKKQYQLIIADYDGYNQKSIVTSSNPITSLAWSPNDKQIAYTSLESGKPVVYVQDIYQTTRYIAGNFNGSNSSPSFTADGTKLSLTLSKDDEGSHIYLINNTAYSATTMASPLIKFGRIDTEASFGSDDNVVFTSNHDGGPQIFMTNLHGGGTKRLTINLGNYNTTAKFAHHSNKITFVHRDYGTLKAYVMDLTTTPYVAYPVNLGTNLDMAPSFAPNDKLILFSSSHNMYIVNTLGTLKTQILNINANEILDQRWSNNY
jgi:TolB protein